MQTANPLRIVFRFIAGIAVFIYFLIDAIFAALVAPFGRWLSETRPYQYAANWIASLPRYPTLALFLIPLIVLEPAKPAGFYLIATGRFKSGIGVIAAAEILKMLIVERLFHLSRDKLMTIPAFAACYNVLARIAAYIRASAIWRMIEMRFKEIKAAFRRLVRHSRD